MKWKTNQKNQLKTQKRKGWITNHLNQTNKKLRWLGTSKKKPFRPTGLVEIAGKFLLAADILSSLAASGRQLTGRSFGWARGPRKFPNLHRSWPVVTTRLWVKTLHPGEHQNRWQMDVHPGCSSLGNSKSRACSRKLGSAYARSSSCTTRQAHGQWARATQ